MKFITLMILLITALIGACTDIDLQTAPRCLEDKIKEFKKFTFCDDAGVYEYEFQNQIVFLFGAGSCCCDHSSEVVDIDCNHLGFLGGFAGNTKINGEKFSNATYIRTIWEK